MTNDDRPTTRGGGADRKERHAQASRLFQELLELAPEARSGELEARTAANPALRAEVSRLLDHADGPDLSEGIRAGLEDAAEALLQQADLPDKVGHHVIQEEIGRGGMGVVYRAHDTVLDRSVALKALPRGIDRDPDSLTRLKREAKLLASLSHPNVATVHGLELDSDWPHVVLEHVEGETLAARLAAHGTLPMREALDVSLQVARGMEAAHARGVLHRDIKPSNVMVTPEGAVKVLDFGLAKALGAATVPRPEAGTAAVGEGLSLDGFILGTPGYMSPEQAEGAELSERTDVWSFGCLMYECLTGRAAFEGDTPDQRIDAVLEREPDWSALPVETPAAARELLRACLHREAARRPRNGGEVRWALEAAVAESPGTSQWRRLVAVGMVASLAIAALALVVTLATRPVPEFAMEARLMTERRLPNGDFSTSALTDELILEEGDGIYLEGLRPNVDATVQVFLLSPDGSVALLYPEDEGVTPLPFEAGRDRRLPERGVWRLDDAVGTEILFVAATPEESPDAIALLDRVDAAVREATPMAMATNVRGASRASSRSDQAMSETAIADTLGEHFDRVQTFRVRHGR